METAQMPTTAARSSRELRALLMLVGALVALALVVAGAYNLLDLSARGTFITRASYVGVRSLVVESGNGDVHLTGAPPGSKLRVLEHVTEGLTTPARATTSNGAKTLSIRSHCVFILSEQCSVDYQIAVPSEVTVRVSTGAGDITVRNLTSRVSLRLSSGAGDISATAISSPDVNLSSGAGDIRATLVHPAELLQASSGAGDLVLTVPNVAYAVTTSSGVGNITDSSLRIDPASPRRINASAGAGDVTVRASP
jgi:Putative adhesin